MRKLLSSFFLLLFMVFTAIAQEKTVSGTVKGGDDNLPLPGVSVRVKGSTKGTQTGAGGQFSIKVPGNHTTLVFTYVGYSSQELHVGNRTTLNVTLASDATQLGEVVVQVPYGAIKKTAFTGSEATINQKVLENQQVTSFTRALEGAVPGLQSTNGGGGPGTSADIRIRGIGSVNASASPLYVIDGVPYTGSAVALSSDDFASVTVLKDAAATALYGSRAANGVIMITTKKGNSLEPKLTLTARTGFLNRAIPEYDRVGVKDYYENMWQATRNRLAGGDPAKITDAINQSASAATMTGLVYNVTDQPNNAVLLADGTFNPNAKILYQDNWQDVLFHSPVRQDYNLNVAGGSAKNTYYVSLGYLDEPGFAKFTGYERFSGRVNLTSKVKEWLSTGLNLDGSLGTQRNTLGSGTYTSNPFYYARMMGPIYPVWQRDAQGNIVKDQTTGADMLDWGVPTQMGARPYAGNSNLLGSLALDERVGKIGNVNFNTFVEARFLKDFTFRTTLGGNYYNRYGTTFQNSQFGDAQNVKGRSTKNQVRQLSYTFNQILTYDKTINEDHHINVLAGHEVYSLNRDLLTATRSGFPFPGNSELAPAATLEGANSYSDNHRIESYLSRFNYSYKERYMFSASFRRDGSSRFFPGDSQIKSSQWGNFFSVGGGWRISQEDFLKDVKWINELKLRASYGEQGNEGVARTRTTDETDQENPTSTSIDNFYGWQSLYELGWNNVNFPGAIVSTLPTRELAWEKNKALNIGVDFALFGNRLEGSVEWYNRESSNLLFQVPLPMSTGITSIWKNIGTMYNRGVELQLGYNAIRSKDFDWRIDLNLSHYKNRITELPEENRAKGIVNGTKKLMEGQDIYRFWLREYAGVNPDNGDALWYRDELDASGAVTGRTTTNNINNATYYYHGTAIPDLNGGFSNSFRYKNFDLSVMLTFQLGGKFYDSNYSALMHTGSYGTAWHTDILNAWKKPGDVTDVPRLQNALGSAFLGNATSSRFLVDASYLNIKNITLGYRFNQALMNRIGVSSLRVFANVDNAALFTKRKGMDPQRAFNGTADNTYPTMRNFTFGLTLGL